MCGIAGVLEFEHAASPSPEGLRRMAAVMTHRGPDEEGVHVNGPVGLAHRRLSIIDLESGKQPMATADNALWVVFNGELYNFPELRNELAGKGYAFRTRSDTEVLLSIFREHGVEAFSRLNGMFACAFWDSRDRRLVLATDRFGKKPLYYYHDSDRLVFGSEIKALLAYGGIERQVSEKALHEYLTHSFIVGEDSIVRGVRRLPPAHFLTVRDGKIEKRAYWELRFAPSRKPPPLQEAVEEIEGILQRSVKCRLISDVPLGAFLSGGLDSSVVVSIMASVSDRPVRTFTIGFEESDFSELEDARTVAKHIGSCHQEIIVRPSALDILPDLVWYLDEPFGDSSALPTYYVCQAARRHVTVALSGDGGDEVFSGYSRYQELDRYRSLECVPMWMRRGLFRPAAAALPYTMPGWNFLHALGTWKNGDLPAMLGMYPYIRDSLYSREFRMRTRSFDPFESTARHARWADHLDPVSRYQYLDTHEYLPCDILTKVDRMSMANSLEVRSPLLDVRLVEYMASLPVSFKLRDGVSKFILKKYAESMLPPSVLSKQKQGFAIPKGVWFRKELWAFAEEILMDPKTIARGYLDAGNIRRVLTHHAAGRRDYSNWIWCLIILEMWFRTFLDRNVGDRV